MTPKVPMAPTNLTALAGDGQVSLSWAPSAEASSYSIYRRPASGAEGDRRLIHSQWPATHFVDTGLTNGSPYCYVVKARNATGESDASNEVSAIPEHKQANFRHCSRVSAFARAFGMHKVNS